MEGKERESDNLTNEELEIIRPKDISGEAVNLNRDGTSSLMEESIEEVNYSFWDLVDKRLEDIVEEYKDEIIRILENKEEV